MKCMTLLAILITGCSSLVQPSPLDPPGHPLLASLTPQPSNDSPRLSRKRTARRARALIGRSASSDRTLLEALFPDHDLAQATGSEDLLDETRTRQGRARVGDLLVFIDGADAPSVGVITATLAGGVLEAAAVTRGKVRKIRVDRRRPDRRRANGRILNTFIRARHINDPAGLPYLAGQRLIDIRRVD